MTPRDYIHDKPIYFSRGQKLMILRRLQRKPQFTVTVIVGIVCKDSIVLASDSRTTNPDGTIRDNATKISMVGTDDFGYALFAESGHADLSCVVVEDLKRQLFALAESGAPITDYRAVADQAELAVARLKNKIREQFKGTSDELQRHFSDHSFELMIAYYFLEDPYVFTLDFVLGVAAWKRDRNLVTIGCGSVLADFCLEGIDVSKMNDIQAMATAIYAIEEVKRFDPRCGGPIQVGVAGLKRSRSGKVTEECFVPEPDIVAKAVEEVLAASSGVKSSWKKKLNGVVDRFRNRISIEPDSSASSEPAKPLPS